MSNEKKAFLLTLLPILCLGFSIPAQPVAAEQTDATSIQVKPFRGKADVHTVMQDIYLTGGTKTVTKLANGWTSISIPDPIYFEWEGAGSISDVSYTLNVSESPAMTNPWIYQTKETRLGVYNLKIDTRYYYQVMVGEGDDAYASSVASFTTTAVPLRNLFIEGVENVRDIGGWVNREGNERIKQGKIYRSAQLDHAENGVSKTLITKNGKKEMRRLGIKTHIDLREDVEANQNGVSVLGSEVNYYHIPMKTVWDSTMISQNAASIKQVFDVLANPDAYPIVYQCTNGADCTGMLSFLLEGMLGVSEGDMARDYLFSNFSYLPGSRSRIGFDNYLVAGVQKYSGVNITQKVIRCLRDIGISSSTLNAVYLNLMEGI